MKGLFVAVGHAPGGPTPAARAAAAALRAAGASEWAFLADGPGGRALEAAVRGGGLHAVVHLALTDLAAGTADPDRLTAASLLGLPQVVVPGGLPADLSPQQGDRIGQDVAQKVSASAGPAAVLLPLRGLTPAGAAFAQSVRNWAYGFDLEEVDAGADEAAAGAAAVATLARLVGGLK